MISTIFTLSVILSMLLAALMIYFGFGTNLLREKCEINKKPPYSFSRSQLWLWTLVIVPLFILRWGCKMDLSKLNDTCMILLGISATTSLASGLITKIKKQNLVMNMNKEERENSQPSDSFKCQTESKGFWIDIFLDDQGQYSLTRVQQFLFIIAYVFIFITFFINENMEFPEFDTNAFLLMGVSSGAYLWGKGINK